MLGGDETTCGNQVNQFFSYSNGHGFYNSEFTAGSGFVNTRREVIEAVFPANSHVASNSMLGDSGQALLQHFLAANNYNPSGLMKLWWGGVVIPDEVSSKIGQFGAWIVCDRALLLGESRVAREITREPHANEDAGARDWEKNCQFTVGHFSNNGISLRQARRRSYEKPLLIVASCPFLSPLAASCSLVRFLAIRFTRRGWKVARRLVPDQWDSKMIPSRASW